MLLRHIRVLLSCGITVKAELWFVIQLCTTPSFFFFFLEILALNSDFWLPALFWKINPTMPWTKSFDHLEAVEKCMHDPHSGHGCFLKSFVPPRLISTRNAKCLGFVCWGLQWCRQAVRGICFFGSARWYTAGLHVVADRVEVHSIEVTS